MNILLYLKATGQIVGRVDRLTRVEEEITNLMRSELGGIPADYAHVEIDTTPPGTRPIRVMDGVVEYESTVIPPTPTQARIAELLAIPRSDWTTAQMRELLQLTAEEG